MWDNLFKFVLRAASVEPNYSKNNCIAYNQSIAACSACKDICPHDAISFKLSKEVIIDDIDCTGCGLCVQACPSQALEARLNYQSGADIRCSQVKGNTQSVQCLARLSHIDLIRLAGSKNKLVLARADCSNCDIGNGEVLDRLEQNQTKAKELANFRAKSLEIKVIETKQYNNTDNPDPISRRDLLRGGWHGIKQGASDALLPLDPGDEEDNILPKTMVYQKQIIALAKPKAQDLVPWRLPQIADNCILCPVCTNICPSNAFSRDFEPIDKDGTVLEIKPDHCNGCDACVKACPVSAITMTTQVTWATLSEGKTIAFYKDPSQANDENIAR